MDFIDWNHWMDVAVGTGLDVVAGILLLIFTWMAASWAKRWVTRMLLRIDRIDEMLASFFASLVRYTILVVGVIAVLHQFGVQTASLIAVLGAAGLAIGLAMQGTLSNVASGVMLLIFRPFKVGDFVEIAGKSGTVKYVTLFFTELATPDNKQITLPNSMVWGDAVVNYSHHDTRRVDFVVGIGYDDDIGKAMDVIRNQITADDRVHDEPEPMIVVSNLGDSAVDITVRAWADGGDYWGVYFDNTRAFKELLDEAGISIPYPQRDVHLFEEKAA